MRIERYYASVQEESSTLSNDAATLLARDDYIGFFKSCGPTYIRGLRRAQEVDAFLEFESSSNENASSYSAQVQTFHWWYSQSSDGTYQSDSRSITESSSLTITIKGYGLGLSEDGSETLIATSLADLNNVMRFAFRTMTKSPNYMHIGMVYGMEVMPWANNANFITTAGLSDQSIQIPQSRNLIPKAFRIGDSDDTNFVNNDAYRALFRCKDPLRVIDMFGSCCSPDSLYDNTIQEYEENSPHERYCRPVVTLDPYMVRENMSANGEFIARLDDTVRSRLVQLNAIERCISAVRAIPSRYDFHILKTNDNALFDAELVNRFTPYDLKLAMDPFNDFSMVKHMGIELDEFLSMYVSPCYDALFGSNVGTSPGVDASYFMSYPWYSHPECLQLSCLAQSVRWDRSSPTGGCIPSLVQGADSPNFDDGENNCLLDNDSSGNVCKHNNTEMSEFHTRTTTCWEAALPTGSIDYFMTQYCDPQITNQVLSDDLKYQLQRNTMAHCGDRNAGDPISINVAKDRPAYQSSTYSSSNFLPRAGLAVDGNTDANYYRQSTSLTQSQTDPWWRVELGESHIIKRISIYNRSDGGSAVRQLSSGYTISIWLGGVKQWEETRSDLELEEDFPDISDGTTTINGDEVKVTLTGDNRHLQLTEVEVWNEYYP